MNQPLFINGFDNTFRARDLTLYLENTYGYIRRLDMPITKNQPYAFVHFMNEQHVINAAKDEYFRLGKFKIQMRCSQYEKKNQMNMHVSLNF